MRKVHVVALLAFLAGHADASLVSHWKLDETSGQAAIDSAGDSDGTLGSSVGVDTADPGIDQPGVFGRAYSFTSGDGDRVLIDNLAPFTGLTTGSVTGWFNTASSPRGALMNFGEASTTDRLIVEIVDGGNLRLVIRENNSNQTDLQTTATYEDGSWHHFAFVQDGVSTTLHVDGSEVTALGINTNSAAWFKTITGPSTMSIGWETRSNGQYPFNGTIDDVAIFDHVLSGQELDNVIALGAEKYDIPEPASLALLGLGGLMIATRRRGGLPIRQGRCTKTCGQDTTA